MIQKELKQLADPERAKNLQRFFKTGPGEYGEGDIFIGISVPNIRLVAKKYIDIEFSGIEKLLHSKIHEERLTAILILVERFKKDEKKIFNFYLNNTKYIDNWDLVDLSAHKIIGKYLFDKNRDILYKLAKSNSLWERRISIISTFWFINNNQFDDSLKIAEILLKDKHDLIHKAVGWMLREIGKKSMEKEEEFLIKHYEDMPRTMLRYAIEKFPEDKRQSYLKGLI